MPIILLTARGQVFDKILGLDMGADDYIVKPVDFGELLARIRAIGRRRKSNFDKETMISVGNLVIYPDKYQLEVSGIRIELTSLEFDLMFYIIRNRARVATREMLLDHVWGYNYAASTNLVDATVSRMRRKFLHHGCDFPLQTIRGVGYIWEDASGG